MSDTGLWIFAGYLLIGAVAGVLIAPRIVPDDDTAALFYRGLLCVLITLCWITVTIGGYKYLSVEATHTVERISGSTKARLTIELDYGSPVAGGLSQ